MLSEGQQRRGNHSMFLYPAPSHNTPGSRDIVPLGNHGSNREERREVWRENVQTKFSKFFWYSPARLMEMGNVVKLQTFSSCCGQEIYTTNRLSQCRERSRDHDIFYYHIMEDHHINIWRPRPNLEPKFSFLSIWLIDFFLFDVWYS